MIKIVTVEREYGSGGGEIAQLLADRLGWKLWDQLLTEEIARMVDCPKSIVESHEERNDPLYYRLFKSFMRGSYEGSINAPKLKMVDSECVLRITRNVVLKVAEIGNCVIVGRGSQHFLENRTDTLRVFLYASTEEKVRRVAARGHSEAEARELVETVDRDRVAYIQKYFKVEWPTRWLYHIMLNTSVGEINVVDAIISFMRSLNSSK
jgi:Cytidylate kinase-like family